MAYIFDHFFFNYISLNGGVGACFANIEVRKPELTSLVVAVVVCIWHLAFAVVVGEDVQLPQLRPSLLLYLIHRVLLPYGSFFLLEYCFKRRISCRRRLRWLNSSYYSQCLAFSLQTRVEAMNIIFSHHILICVFNDKDSPSIGLRPLVRYNLSESP